MNQAGGARATDVHWAAQHESSPEKRFGVWLGEQLLFQWAPS